MEVHVLVARAFHGRRPAGWHIRHLDGESKNNCADNLAYGTAKENAADRITHGTMRTGESCSFSKLTASQVDDIRRRAANGEVQAHLAREFGVGPMQISRIVRWQRWKRYAELGRRACEPQEVPFQ